MLTDYPNFSNHFQFPGWGSAIDLTKYYEMTVTAPKLFRMHIACSVELTTTGTTDPNLRAFWELRTSESGYAVAVASGSWRGGEIHNLDIDLGDVPPTVTLRWYFWGATEVAQIGFANHLPGGAGSGSPDIGQAFDIFACKIFS